MTPDSHWKQDENDKAVSHESVPEHLNLQKPKSQNGSEIFLIEEVKVYVPAPAYSCYCLQVFTQWFDINEYKYILPNFGCCKLLSLFYMSSLIIYFRTFFDLYENNNKRKLCLLV